MRSLLLVVLLPAMGCYRPREVVPEIPLPGIDGKYSFAITNPSVALEGRFMVVHSQVHLLAPRRCVPIEGPKSSAELRAAWFECWGAGQQARSAASLRLRISEIDPMNRSRWYARMRVQDTVVRCTRYQANGDCTEILRARGMKWVDRNGTIAVTRGWPVPPDTGLLGEPKGNRPLRVRCDTASINGSCVANRREEVRP
jgi:hypothetical protein